MMLHTYTSITNVLLSINFLHLTVSEIQAGETFSRHPPAHPDTMGENNTPTALKGCGVKTDQQKISKIFSLSLQVFKLNFGGIFSLSFTDLPC